MGALSFWGGLAGAGQGIAQSGQMMGQEQLRQDQLQAMLERTREQQAGAAARNENSMDTKLAIMQMKLDQAGAGKGGAGLRADQVLADPVLFARLGGLTAEDAQSFLDITKNGANQQADLPGDTPDAQGTTQTVKYQPGQAADILQRGYAGLRRAIGLGDPSHADDLAKAANTEYVTDAARRFEKGDANAGGGSLVAQGKTPYGETGSSHLTGKPAEGSVAESIIGKNESAGEIKGNKDQIASLREERLAINNDIAGAQKMIERAQAQLKTLPDDATTKDLNATIKEQTERIRAAQKRSDMLSSKITQLGGGAAAAGALAAASGDPMEMARAEAVSSGQQVNFDLGGKKGSFDATGKQVGGESLKADAAQQAPTDPKARKIGATYMTPRGPLVWVGNGWKKP